MSLTLTIRDEELGGKSGGEFSLDFLTEQISVEELIRSRVFQEVKDYNARGESVFQGLVQPADAERTLNGYRLKAHRKIDWKLQFEKAIEAFHANQILILVNDRQVESLDEQIVVGPKTAVTFLRLQLLVGG